MARWAWLAALALAAAACGGEPQPGPDTSAPKVVRTEPVDGAVGVERSVKIRAWFDEPVDNQRIVWDDQLHLVREDGASLYGNGSYDLQEYRATLSLAMDLLPGQTYQVVLEPRICDLAGNCITQPIRWSFAVAN